MDENEAKDGWEVNDMRTDTDEIVKAVHLTKDYGKGKGIFDLEFTVKKGEVYGIVGTNGSGKTTTMRHLMGFLKPDSGESSVLGYSSWKKPYKFMDRVGYVPGEIDFPDVGSGRDFLRLQAGYLGIRNTEYISELIDLFKIDVSAGLKRMSKGMKQKTALVAAFMRKPEVLLLDEPSTGLDPLMRDTLIELILREKERGCTIVMSSHIFKELDDTCDRVAFIKNGDVLAIGRPEELFLSSDDDIKEFLGESFENLPKEGINIQLFFMDDTSNEPVITSLARNLNIDFSICYGKLENFKDNILGSLVINIDKRDLERVMQFLKKKNVYLEVLDERSN